jgi:hypothetical protein
LKGSDATPKKGFSYIIGELNSEDLFEGKNHADEIRKSKSPRNPKHHMIEHSERFHIGHAWGGIDAIFNRKT